MQPLPQAREVTPRDANAHAYLLTISSVHCGASVEQQTDNPPESRGVGISGGLGNPCTVKITIIAHFLL